MVGESGGGGDMTLDSRKSGSAVDVVKEAVTILEGSLCASALN